MNDMHIFKVIGIFLLYTLFYITATLLLIIIFTPKGHGESMVVRKAAIEEGAYMGGANYDPYLQIDNPNEHLANTTNMIMNVDLLCSPTNMYCLYWDNKIASKSTNIQYRFVSWEFSFGFAFGEHLELEAHHLSVHELDKHNSQEYHTYPVENVFQINMNFINKPREIK